RATLIRNRDGRPSAGAPLIGDGRVAVGRVVRPSDRPRGAAGSDRDAGQEYVAARFGRNLLLLPATARAERDDRRGEAVARDAPPFDQWLPVVHRDVMEHRDVRRRDDLEPLRAAVLDDAKHLTRVLALADAPQVARARAVAPR